MDHARLEIVALPAGSQRYASFIQELTGKAVWISSAVDARLRVWSEAIRQYENLDGVSLSDLTGRLLTLCQIPGSVIANTHQVEAALSRSLLQLPESSPLYASARYSNTARLIARGLSELRHWGLSPGELETRAADAPSPLNAKLESLARVWQESNELLAESGLGFATDRIHLLLQQPPPPFVPVDAVVFAMGSEVHPMAEKLLVWLSQAVPVTVVVDSVGEGHRAFGEAERLGQRLGVDVRYPQEPIWTQGIFEPRLRLSHAPQPAVEIFSAGTPLAECEWVLRRCQALLSEGILPHRIQIFTREPEKYSPLLQATSDRFNIPLSLVLRQPLLTNGFAALVLEVLEVLAGDDVRRINRLARNSYMPTTQDERIRLEDAAKLAYAHGQESWQHLNTWVIESEQAPPWLKALLRWKLDAANTPAPLHEWVNRLRLLIYETEADRLSGVSDSPTLERDRPVHAALQRPLVQWATINPAPEEQPWTFAAFLQLARDLWEREEITIRRGDDSIRVQTSTDALEPCDALFALGMLEGEFPHRRTEDALLHDADRHWLSEHLRLEPPLLSSHAQIAEERADFIRVASSPSRRLVMSYPLTDEDRDNIPTLYLNEVEELAGSVERGNHPVSELVPAKDRAINTWDRRLVEALNGPTEWLRVPKVTHPLAQEKIRPDADAPLRLRRIVDAVQCPFRSVAAGWHLRRAPSPPSKAVLSKVPERDRLHIVPNQSVEDHLRSSLNAVIDQNRVEWDPWQVDLMRILSERQLKVWAGTELQIRELGLKDTHDLVFASTEPEGGLREELRKDSGIRLKEKAIARTYQDGVSTLYYFTRRSWSSVRGLNGLLRREDRIAVGIETQYLYEVTLAFLQKPSPDTREFRVIVVDPGGRVVLLRVGRASDVARPPLPASIQVINLDGDEEIRMSSLLVQELKKGYDALQAATMEPTPGDYCRHCSFADLCRWSPEHRHEEVGS